MENTRFKNTLIRLSAVLLTSVCLFSAQTAQAEIFKLKVTPSLSTDFRALENSDLGTASDDQQRNTSIKPRIRIQAELPHGVEALIDARAVLTNGNAAGEDSDTGQSTPNTDYAELRQYYLKFDGSSIGADAFNLQVGRQRIREDQSLWWNRDIEAVRINYDTTLLKGFVAVAQTLSSNKTTDDFYESSEERLRFLGEASLNYMPDHFIDVRALYENDHSGSGRIGQVIDSRENDREDFTGLWYGARAHGQIQPPVPSVKKIAYKLDAIGVTGSDDITSTSFTTSTTRTITAINDRDVSGWAIDATTDFTLDAPLTPTFTLGYAFGSDDFRQSDLHGNSSLDGASSGSIYHYGEVLRPELSNLHILTVGAGVPVGDASDINMLYHYYRLSEKATSLRSGSVAAALNGQDKDLGQAFDIIFNSNLTREFDLKTTPVEIIKFRASAGVFDAGDAYGAADDETAARVFTELLFSF